MSFDIAIKIDGLSKSYQIYNQPLDRLREFVFPHLQQVFGQQARKYYKEFWALKNVSFEVKKGETVGIIGRNGSGKSTLLQMICGTINPSNGIVQANGRIAALLELGAGFNPEFSGRENVFLSGALHGLSRGEIERRFDDIAAFADIGDFIEQPLKTYSSGMIVRLAFSIITNVNAEILVIDEALAVGDAVFTQKCMRFLRKFKEEGTLIFVSHDMGSVLNLCESAIWLDKGNLRQMGESKKVAESYLQYTLQEVYGQELKLNELDNPDTSKEKDTSNILARLSPQESTTVDYAARMDIIDNLSSAKGWKTEVGEIQSVLIEHLIPQISKIFVGGEMVRVVITAKAHQRINCPILGFIVKDRLGQDLFGENTLDFTNLNPKQVSEGASFSAEFVFQLPMLPNGQYAVTASLGEGDLYVNTQHHWLHDALIINVSSSKVRWGLVGVNFEKIEMKEVE